MKNTFRIENGIVWISLTQGKETCIDLADLELASKLKWVAHKCRANFRVVARGTSGDIVYLHRVLMGESALQVEHKDGNALNNCRSNLRFATHGENQRNRGKSGHNTSGFKGVYFDKRRSKWIAGVRVNGKNKVRGQFDSKLEAAQMADTLAKEFHGEFAHLNFPVINS